MEARQFNNLIALKGPEGRTLGLNTQSLEVASLSEESWLSLVRSDLESEAMSELKAWSDETVPAQAKAKHQSLTLTINVTQVCNLHCTYCAAGGDGTYGDPVKKISIEKTLPQIQSFLKGLEMGDSFRVTFLGGEPLLYPLGISMIYEYTMETCRALGVEAHFSVVTNGTLLTDSNIELLKRMKADITISLDGPAEINDRFRPSAGGKGVTAKVEAGLRDLLQHKPQLGRIGLAAVLGKHQTDVEIVYNYFSQFTVDWFSFAYDHTELSDEVNEAYMASLEKVARIAYEKGGETELRRIKTFDQFFDLLDRKQRVFHYCGAGQNYFVADSRNNLFACQWLVGKSAELIGHGTALFEDKVKEYEGSLVEKNGCGQCWARNLCGGGCMFIHQNKTGSKHKVDKAFCKRTQFTIAQALFYYEKSRVYA